MSPTKHKFHSVEHTSPSVREQSFTKQALAFGPRLIAGHWNDQHTAHYTVQLWPDGSLHLTVATTDGAYATIRLEDDTQWTGYIPVPPWARTAVRAARRAAHKRAASCTDASTPRGKAGRKGGRR